MISGKNSLLLRQKTLSKFLKNSLSSIMLPVVALRWYLTRKRIIVPLAIVTANVVLGTLGYVLIEGFPFFDAFYMTIITVATVGYGEIHPLSFEGRLFTAILIVSSFGTFAYAISQLTRYVVEGEFNEFFQERRQKKIMQQIDNHVIVCGFGRNGRQAAHELSRHKTLVVVIEKNHDEAFFEDVERGILFQRGDATHDEALLKAGIKKASALICALPSDADNVFIVLSARALNPTLRIISRASEDTSVSKLRTAGTDHIIMPDKVGGSHMATLVTRPDAVEFLEAIELNESVSMAVIKVPQDYQKLETWAEIGRKSAANLTFLGLKREDGTFVVHPKVDTVITSGTKIFVLGEVKEVESLRKVLGLS